MKAMEWLVRDHVLSLETQVLSHCRLRERCVLPGSKTYHERQGARRTFYCLLFILVTESMDKGMTLAYYES
jgi:hypothetical protein